ncbi:hypothetical protein TNCV_4150431 [Trichonephila clavipes]|uniref:Uncharacterized protein n=1 Tax=Trichonephila clavipes TaxID=2585209 RepID=A0A8X6W5E2_TRICX|nr:hypothetical protein TNCV_4150431 [Trichonephila clavipes]
MFLAGHPSEGCFGLQSHCAPCYFFNQASFYPSDFSFTGLRQHDGNGHQKSLPDEQTNQKCQAFSECSGWRQNQPQRVRCGTQQPSGLNQSRGEFDWMANDIKIDLISLNLCQ